MLTAWFCHRGSNSICVARVSLQKEARRDEVLTFRAIGARRLRRRWQYKNIGRWTDVAHHHHGHVHRLSATCRRDYCSVPRNTCHVAKNFAVQPHYPIAGSDAHPTSRLTNLQRPFAFRVLALACPEGAHIVFFLLLEAGMLLQQMKAR